LQLDISAVLLTIELATPEVWVMARGKERKRGSSNMATDAKKQSMSMCKKTFLLCDGFLDLSLKLDEKKSELADDDG
jgi:hypothetical protein